MASVLFQAVSSGDYDSSSSYLLSGGEVDVTDEEESTPLMYAAANGHEKVVRLLLNNGAQVDRKNRYGWTALLQASCYGHHDVVYTLSVHGGDVNDGNGWGTTPLVAASLGGNFIVIQNLLDLGAEVNTKEEVRFVTPLMAAAQCGNELIVEKLISAGSNVNSRYEIIGWTALMLATLNNHLNVVKVLLNNGANKDVKDINNCRAVDLAASLKHADIVNILSDSIVSISNTDVDIFKIIDQDNLDGLKKLVAEDRVSLNAVNIEGSSPLILATKKGNMQIIQFLLDSGADVDFQDCRNGWTAFMYAIKFKNHSIAQLLGSYNANVSTIKAKNGTGAFDLANSIGDVKMIQLIAHLTIQNLSNKSDVQSDQRKQVESSDNTDATSTKESISTEDILRRLSNAYLASEPSKIDDNQTGNKGFLYPRSTSPYTHRTPSPDVTVIPPTNNPLAPRPIIQIPTSIKSVKHNSASTKVATDSKNGLPSVRPSKLQFAMPADNNVSRKFIPLSRNAPPIINSPRSLPSDPFSFFKPISIGKGRESSSFRREESKQFLKPSLKPNLQANKTNWLVSNKPFNKPKNLRLPLESLKISPIITNKGPGTYLLKYVVMTMLKLS
jgi:ankyrin repeat protein